MKKRTLYTIGSSIVAVFLIFIALFLLQRLLVPKYMDNPVEGRFIQEYYNEPNKDFDVIFLGDCEVYSSFSPPRLWEQYGINSYIRGSANQYIWQSYYLLKDTLRYDKPKVCVFNVLSMQYDHATNEAYNRMTLEGMEWSPYKVKSINASMRKEEHFTEYVFPILRYHDRWDELDSNDFRYMFKEQPTATFNGFYMQTGFKAANDFGDGKPLPDYDFDERCWRYLDMIRMCCESNNIKLILIKAPSLYPYWYDEWDEQIVSYADEYNLQYINYYNISEEVGIDYDTDTYDGGLHLNLSGAEKMSDSIGEVLLSAGAEDRRDDAKLSRQWQEKLAVYRKQADTEKEN